MSKVVALKFQNYKITAIYLSLFFFLFRVRFHYGHPDVFDRLFHLTRGGVSKASKIINLSEDIFAGKFLFTAVATSFKVVLCICLA